MKKAVGLGLAAAMAVSMFAGCGNKTDDTVYKIGGIGPLTGSAADYGISVKQGAEIAIEEINAAGGIKVGDKTLKIEMKFADDEASAELATTAYNSVMDWGAQAILGNVTSGACLAVNPLSYEDGILQLTPSGSAAGCTEFSNGFRLCFTDPLQGQLMADYAKEQGYNKIAVIYNNSDDYSFGIKDAFKARVAENGGVIVAEEAFVTDATDFTAQLTNIKSTDAQVIFVPAYYNDAAYIISQAIELGMNLPYLGCDGWDGVLAQLKDNPNAANGAVFLSPFVATVEDEAVQNFVKKYQEKYKSTPSQFAADGYDCVYVIKAAVEKAGSVENADVIAAMVGLQFEGLTGSATFDKNGEPNKGAKFIEIKDATYTVQE
ncbi:MAG: ABC transporter substrate-binding protein [Lachnospiraceae bacterium]|nr:ABC transporter substrate-binding protein [Lachnospiraceae bacterium]